MIEDYTQFGHKTQTPNRIVVHSMAEYLDFEPEDIYAPDFLKKLGLSAHVLITPEGVEIRQRHDHEGAWHAKGFNKDSLGVEILVKGVHTYGSFLKEIKKDYVTEEQFETLVNLCRGWIEKHDIKHVDRHSDLSPGRKFDPGSGFDWNRFLTEIYGG